MQHRNRLIRARISAKISLETATSAIHACALAMATARGSGAGGRLPVDTGLLPSGRMICLRPPSVRLAKKRGSKIGKQFVHVHVDSCNH